MNFNQFGMANSIVKGLEALHDLFTPGFCAQKLKYILLTPSYNMTMQNGHDVNVHTLHPTDNGIHHAKLIGVHP